MVKSLIKRVKSAIMYAKFGFSVTVCSHSNIFGVLEVTLTSLSNELLRNKRHRHRAKKCAEAAYLARKIFNSDDLVNTKANAAWKIVESSNTTQEILNRLSNSEVLNDAIQEDYSIREQIYSEDIDKLFSIITKHHTKWWK